MASLALHSLKQGQPLTILLRKRARTVLLFFSADNSSIHREVLRDAAAWPQELLQPVYVCCSTDLSEAQNAVPDSKHGNVYWSGPEGLLSPLCQRLEVSQLPWLVVMSEGRVLSCGQPTAQRLAAVVSHEDEKALLEKKCQEQEETIRRLERRVKVLTRELDSYAALFRKYSLVIPELKQPSLEESKSALSATELDYWDSCINDEDKSPTLRLEDIGSRSLWVTTTMPHPSAIANSLRRTELFRKFDPSRSLQGDFPRTYSPDESVSLPAVRSAEVTWVTESRAREALDVRAEAAGAHQRRPHAALRAEEPQSARAEGRSEAPEVEVDSRQSREVDLSKASALVTAIMAGVGAHLNAQYEALGVKPRVTEGVIAGLEGALRRVVAALGNSRTHVAQEPVNLADYIRQRQAKSQNVEDNIREHRLKEASRLKQELEQKLEHLQDNIKVLEQEAEEPSQKVTLLDSKVRQEYFEQEERRRQETAEFAKKLRQEQLEMARRNKQREEELNRKVQEELEQAQKHREEEEARKQEEKAQKLAELQEKARRRKEDIEQRRRAASEETSRLRSQQYMHERLNQDYVARVLKTEQEKQQEILAKQHLLHQPIRLEEISEHARKYGELQREKQARKEAERQNKLLDSQISGLSQAKASVFTHSVLNQDKQTKLEREQAMEAKRRLQEKKQRYALLVKEMFVPAVDPVKQKEMEVIKERLAHPVTHLTKNSTSRSLSDPQEAVAFEPRKFKDNPMLPKPKPKREAVVVDYLKDQRQHRESQNAFSASGPRGNLELGEDLDDLGEAEKARLIKMRAEKLEREAKRRELVLSQMNPTSPGALEAHESVNDALISSIRAKLSLLK